MGVKHWTIIFLRKLTNDLKNVSGCFLMNQTTTKPTRCKICTTRNRVANFTWIFSPHQTQNTARCTAFLKALFKKQNLLLHTNYFSSPTPRIHCARCVKYGSACERLLRIGPRLWSSAWNSFSNFLQQFSYTLSSEKTDRLEVAGDITKTYKMESVTVAFSVNFSALDEVLYFDSLPELGRGSAISMEEDINHWVAAAYWRHISFNFSIFCKFHHMIRSSLMRMHEWVPFQVKRSYARIQQIELNLEKYRQK